jgi:hypothetical protein
MKFIAGLFVCLLCSAAAPVMAEDRINLDSTSIVGNRELPKVLYIVPWKKPLSGNLVGKPVQSLLDEVLVPLDRDVFRRQVEYYGSGMTAHDRAGSGAGGK